MKSSLALLAALGLSGCAHQYRPMVDFPVRQATPQNYEMDLADCRQYADATPGVGAGAAGGAAIGAVIGALLGAAAGVNAGDMAKFGAAVGGLNGAAAGVGRENGTINSCMRGRGYNVL